MSDRAEAWLESLIDLRAAEASGPRARFSLAPIRALLAAVGHPERGLRPLHVAGSKGKGSTALLAEALLHGAGLRVGTFTSPHLERWTERFRIDGREVEGAALARGRRAAAPARRGAARGGPGAAPTFFDATTAAALLLVRARPASTRVVLEVGLGGRLDSTNVVAPAVTCVTSIELEHTDKPRRHARGDRRGEGGHPEAGCARRLSARLPGRGARGRARARAPSSAARVASSAATSRSRCLEAEPLRQRVRLEDGAFRSEARLPLLGRPRAATTPRSPRPARCAAAASRRSGSRKRPPSPSPAGASGAHRGRSARAAPHRGRRAHTAASARALADALGAASRTARTHLVLSVSVGQGRRGDLRAARSRADAITLTRADPTRSLDPAALAPLLRRAGARARGPRRAESAPGAARRARGGGRRRPRLRDRLGLPRGHRAQRLVRRLSPPARPGRRRAARPAASRTGGGQHALARGNSSRSSKRTCRCRSSPNSAATIGSGSLATSSRSLAWSARARSARACSPAASSCGKSRSSSTRKCGSSSRAKRLRSVVPRLRQRVSAPDAPSPRAGCAEPARAQRDDHRRAAEGADAASRLSRPSRRREGA